MTSLTVERTSEGGYCVSALVDGYLVTRRYFGWNAREVRAMFRREVVDRNATVTGLGPCGATTNERDGQIVVNWLNNRCGLTALRDHFRLEALREAQRGIKQWFAAYGESQKDAQMAVDLVERLIQATDYETSHRPITQSK